ncbi:MAG TPA: type IV pilin protein [Steroidobacteraceae bacterium]|nr:type IV pilin protein [Steroidobacteraceae bacterium]
MSAITMKHKSSGFSLIELMIVCVIVAILGAIVIPSYNAQIRKSRRTEAKTALADFAAREERYYATQNVYATDPVSLQYTTAGTWPVSIGNYYSVTLIPTDVSAATATTPATFVVRVVPSAGSTQLKDTSCQTFLMDNTGKQTSLDSGGADSTSTCWP